MSSEAFSALPRILHQVWGAPLRPPSSQVLPLPALWPRHQNMQISCPEMFVCLLGFLGASTARSFPPINYSFNWLSEGIAHGIRAEKYSLELYEAVCTGKLVTCGLLVQPGCPWLDAPQTACCVQVAELCFLLYTSGRVNTVPPSPAHFRTSAHCALYIVSSCYLTKMKQVRDDLYADHRASLCTVS